MKPWFFELADRLTRELRAGETLVCNLSAERSDFVRFNQARVRQAGSVEQRYLELRLIRERRQVSASVSIFDLDGLKSMLAALREALVALPEDPWLLINEDPQSSESERRGSLPSAEQVVREVEEQAKGRDLVGIYAGGTMFRGFANSLGQRNWHEVDSFHLDWSLHRQGDQAVKASYADFAWDSTVFADRMAAAGERLELLSLPRRQLQPGEYRAYLAPAAMLELIGLLSWGGFSARARQTKQSPLLRMQAGERLSSLVALTENTAEGTAAAFQSDGFVKPPRVTLIADGVLGDSLVSPRSAKEYGLQTNAANGGESPESLDMAGGDLPENQVLHALDEGLYISNLWYLNFSDRPAGRITGMTRFATFWVEQGRIVAPTAPLRFDDSLYRMLGGQLAGLTREREFLPDASTYGERSTSSARLPGALLKTLKFTL